MKVYQAIARCLRGLQYSPVPGVTEMWAERLERIERETLPSGSGFDSGTKVDLESSKPNRIVLETSFHHMNDCGMYDGWTEHKVIVVPDMIYGIDIRITGRDRNGIKYYIGERISDYLHQDYEFTA